MRNCGQQGAGSSPPIVLYFYDELEPDERAIVERHLQSCSECRRAHEELAVIRAALAEMPTVEAPPGRDWAPFMRRLDEAVRFEQRVEQTIGPVETTAKLHDAPVRRAEPDAIRMGMAIERRARVGYAQYLTLAALLTLVTSGVVYVARFTARPPSPSPSTSASSSPLASAPASMDTGATAPAPGSPAAAPATSKESAEAAFAALSEQHFERSKLVVLGLANKDPHRARDSDWAYERGLASTLLSDTRLYRLAAEERGMKTLAGVMGDLEIVLLQTSLAVAPDPEALEQIQRLIHKRDLVTKMDASATGS
jgi:hypothetical protein